MYKNLKTKIKSRQFAVIRRRYSPPEVPWRKIHNAIALAISICKFFKYPSPDTKVSTSPARGEVKKNALHPQCAPDATGFLSDVYNRGTRARKFLADGVQCGRSMIEMLGVLAIIGVLSVGGIAGYSKAMEKWKLNTTFSELTLLINEVIPFSQQFVSYQPGTNLLPIIESLNLKPNSFQDYGTYLTDYWNNRFIAQTCSSSPCWKFYYVLSQKEDVNAKICYQLVSFAQNFTQNIYRVAVNGNFLWGNTHCADGRICLRDQNIQQINYYCANLCQRNCILEIGFE